jgi:hypothetical protein
VGAGQATECLRRWLASRNFRTSVQPNPSRRHTVGEASFEWLDQDGHLRIEPTSEAWGARNKNLKTLELAALNFPSDGLSWKMNGKRNPLAQRACLGRKPDSDNSLHKELRQPGFSLSLSAYASKQIGRPHFSAVVLKVLAWPLPTKILDFLKHGHIQSQGCKSAEQQGLGP